MNAPPRQRRLLQISWSLGLIVSGCWLGLCLWVWSYPWDDYHGNHRKVRGALPGYLMLRIRPSHARVRVNGKALAPGTTGLSLAPGTYSVAAQAPGFFPNRTQAQVFSNDATLARLRLEPHRVEVQIDSEPPGARLSINGKPVGTTPFRGKLLPRWVRLVVGKEGYVEGHRDVRVVALRKNRFRLRLGGALRGGMRWIQGRYFSRGSDAKDLDFALALCKAHRARGCRKSWFSAERPRRSVWLSSFWIDRYEVSAGAYQKCVEAKSCKALRFQRPKQHPAVGVSWSDAASYCRWRGAQLPTEAQWELAARGPKALRFPWGQRWKPRHANHGAFAGQSSTDDPRDGFRFSAPIDAFARGRSPYRVEQMAGNVAEWVADCYYTSYYRVAPERDPFYNPRRCLSRVVRGGSWMQPIWELRTTARQPLPPETQSPTVGFRCAKPADPKPKSQRGN